MQNIHLHCQAFVSFKKPHLYQLVNYSREHANQDRLLMYPEYIRWRNEKYFISKHRAIKRAGRKRKFI